MTDLIKRASETTFCPCEKRNVRTRARVDCTTERRITETNKDQTLYVRARWYLVGCAGYLGIRCTTEYTGRERENEYVCVCERERERELKMERNRRQHTRVSIKPPRARKSRDVEIPATTAGQPEYPRICAATVLHFAADRTISQFLRLDIFYEPGCWWTGCAESGRLKNRDEEQQFSTRSTRGQVVQKSATILIDFKGSKLVWDWFKIR